MSTLPGVDECDVVECDCLDEVRTPLNACSLEALLLPLESGALHVPVVVGCYQLEEATTAANAASDADDHDADSDNAVSNSDAKKAATRSGELRLYSIPLVHNSSDAASSPYYAPQFGEPTQVVPMESGVLDAKWWCSAPTPARAKTGTAGRYLASACASGRIHVHELQRAEETEAPSEDSDDGRGGNAGRHRLLLEHVSSSSTTEEDKQSTATTRLALSLDWEKGETCTDTSGRKIVSSYSDGSICIHTFQLAQREGVPLPVLEEEHRWDAHTLFGCPSEVWTCCFAAATQTGQCALSNDGTNVVISGGDDCTLKLWDVRSVSCGGGGPMAKVGNAEFEAGVTAVSYHPTNENVLAVGSYDEVVRFYDVRNFREPLGRVHVGGGVWRIRWHPNVLDGRMLVGAMHGGCRIVDARDLENPKIVSKFTKHESMAYGADWLLHGDAIEEERGGGESCRDDAGITSGEYYAASCSFYDRRVCLWRSR